MNTRPVDKTKKSNIKCEHCKHYGLAGKCECKQSKNFGKLMNYWNRCKKFEWK